MTERQARDEGATQTRIIIEAVRREREARRWSAAQLADEMAKAGVPWNESVVANLEHGRRKSLRVHELLALLFVLDVPRPLDVLVPGDEQYPVAPGLLVDPAEVRAWLRGETGSLRHKVAKAGLEPAALESVAQLFEQQGQPDMAEGVRRMAKLLTVEGGDDGQG